MNVLPKEDVVVVPLEKMLPQPEMAAQGLQAAQGGATHLHGRCKIGQDVARWMSVCTSPLAARQMQQLPCGPESFSRLLMLPCTAPVCCASALKHAVPVRAPHSACCVQKDAPRKDMPGQDAPRKDMPRNGDQPLVKLSRTGPVYVRLDGIPIMGLGMANGIPPGQLQEQIKADMQRLAAEVRGFEGVHIYSRPLNLPGFAIFVFDNEQGRPKGSHHTPHVLLLAHRQVRP